MGAFKSRNQNNDNQIIYGNVSPAQVDQLSRQYNVPVDRVNLLRQKYLQYRGRNHLINVYNFIILYREFVNANASDVDIYKVFNAFDFNRDGLINFLELLRAISMQPQVSTPLPPQLPPLNNNVLATILPPCAPAPQPIELPLYSPTLSDISLPPPPTPIPLPRYKRKVVWQPPTPDYYPIAPRRKLKKVIVYVPRRRTRSYSPPPDDHYYKRYSRSRSSRRPNYEYHCEPLDYDKLQALRDYDNVIYSDYRPSRRVRYLDDLDTYY